MSFIRFGKPYFWLIRFVGLIVPRRLRLEWRQEWVAELEWRELQLAQWDKLNWQTKFDLLRRSTSAFWDALWLLPQLWEDEMLQDLRFGVRMLFKHKVFTAVAVLTLALGIGATTAIFSVVNGVLLRSLPYEQPERLVMLDNARFTYTDLSNAKPEVTWQYRFNWLPQAKSLHAVSAYSAGDGGVNLSGLGEAERVEAVEVSANFFQTLGVTPVLGRTFAAEEEHPGKQLVAIISYELWQRRLNGALDAIGRSLSLNGKSFTIVGVAPPQLRFPREVEVWIPLSPSVFERVFTNPGVQYRFFGRLQEGATLSQASQELNAIKDSATPAMPLGRRIANDRTVRVTQLLDSLVGDLRKVLWLLLGAVGLVLLIASSNVANLLLALAATRQRELAVRAALGAERLRLLRQTLTESCVLALIGGTLGLLVAVWLMRLLVWLSPPQLPRLHEITLDYRVLAFACVASLMTGLFTGVLPAWRAAQVDLNRTLKDGGGVQPTGSGGRRLRGSLVVVQVALSVVLLVGAGLLVRSFVNVINTQAGFATENLLTISLSLPRGRYSNAADMREFWRQLLERLQSQPMFEAVSATNKPPLNKAEVISLAFEVEGAAPVTKFDERFAIFNVADAAYFRTMGIQVVQGRGFTDGDHPEAAPVIIINEKIARRHFPDGQALGRRVTIPGEEQQREIVGVVNNVRSFRLEDEGMQEMYLPYRQGGPLPTTLVLKTAAAPALALRVVQDAVQSLDKNLPLFNGKTMRQQVYDSVAQRSYLLWLMGALALLGLLLTTAGIYGVISYAVTQRTHEIGIRMALGATHRAVVKLVLRETFVLVGAGLLVGLIAAWLATRWLVSMLYGLREHDPLTLAAVTVLMLLAALLAGWLPARRATQVDPLVALRHD